MICNRCQIDKDISEFHKRTDTKKGIRGTCRDCTNNSHRKWYQDTQDERRKYAGKWYANNREKVIKQKVSGNLRARRLARLDCIKHYSGGKNCCDCCGEGHLEFLAIDHIKGGGNKHRKSLRRGTYLPVYLKRHKYPKGYRILCHNCNMSIGFYGYCPHQGWKM